MKTFFNKVLFCVMAACLSVVAANAQDSSAEGLAAADKLLGEDKYAECKAALEAMLPQAGAGNPRAEVLWRLSRIHLILGQDEKTDAGKQSCFGKGMTYASEAIKHDPKNPECYMWHCANVGRECQTHGLTYQMKALPKMTDDLTTILDKLGRTNHSAAWQALAEIYYNHPFKSTDGAINFTRKAAMCIPKGEIRLSTYVLLARMLYERNDSRSKRASAIEGNAAKFRKAYSSNIDKYEYFDGSLGAAFKHPWSRKGIGMISDREEAAEIAAYAAALYRNAPRHSRTDNSDYKELTALTSKWK